MVIKMQDVLGPIGVRKTLPITKFLNYELNKLRELGVIQNVFTVPEQNCPLNENPMPITIFKMVFLFTVFVLGGILAIIIFTFERAVSYKKDGTLERIDGRAIANRGLRTTMAPPDFGMSVTYLTLSQLGRVDYAHYITTTSIPGFSGLPTYLRP